MGKGCPKSITWDPEESIEFVCVLVMGRLDAGVDKKGGGELKFPDGEGNLAGGRAELGICGDKGGKLIVFIGGTLTAGSPMFLFSTGANGKGVVNEDGDVFIPGCSCEGLLYI